jgi:glycosyltransferase involved in cell wall biosynthesis
MKRPILDIVIPAYNEAAVLPMTLKTLTFILKRLLKKKKISGRSRIVVVDDGSKDETWEVIRGGAPAQSRNNRTKTSS